MFTRLGVITYPADAASEDDLIEAGLEAGAENVETVDGMHEVTCPVRSFFAVRDALETRFGEPASAKLDWRPSIRLNWMKTRHAACSN